MIQIPSKDYQLETVQLVKTSLSPYDDKRFILEDGFVDRLGKLPSKEQQLSRTQHFILKAHAAMFGLHRTPLTPMIQGQNCLLSTSSLSKRTINMLISFEK